MFGNSLNKSQSRRQTIGCTIDPGCINDCHRLGKNNDKVIIKFTRRKDCKQILQVKKDFNDSRMIWI